MAKKLDAANHKNNPKEQYPRLRREEKGTYGNNAENYEHEADILNILEERKALAFLPAIFVIIVVKIVTHKKHLGYTMIIACHV